MQFFTFSALFEGAFKAQYEVIVPYSENGFDRYSVTHELIVCSTDNRYPCFKMQIIHVLENFLAILESICIIYHS